jgi:hypothetical protein
MPAPNRTHAEDLAVDEFQPVLITQNPSLTHPMKFIDREKSLGNLCHHRCTLLIDTKTGTTEATDLSELGA